MHTHHYVRSPRLRQNRVAKCVSMVLQQCALAMVRGYFRRFLILNQSYCLKTWTKFLVLQFSNHINFFLKNANIALATFQPFQLLYLLFSVVVLLFNCFSALSGWMLRGRSYLLWFCFLCWANNSCEDTSIFAHVSPWLSMKNNFRKLLALKSEGW